jgi:hypothetical protein
MGAAMKKIFAVVSLGLPVLVPQAIHADFGSDVALLKKHTDVIVLSDKTGKSQVAVVPQYQGRVMTSTINGARGNSFGWINKKAIAQNKRQPHINVFGGEDRLWFGPEGGQYSIFFPKGAKFEFKDWETPAVIDWGGWPLVSKSRSQAKFRKSFTLTNYSGTKFNARADRTVRLLGVMQIREALGGNLGKDVQVVAYESDNRLTNTGGKAWTKQGGLLSIWILGMYNPSPNTKVVIPFKAGPESKLGPVVNDAYFGKVAGNRLKIDNAKGVLFFKADGKARGKIGIPPRRAKKTMGSWDGKILTIVEYTLPGATDYVNSMWELQKNPYAGDAANSYNDGPLPTGGQMGPFYELESSSPAAALRPGQTLRHVHRTLHLQGPIQQLDIIARRKLGASVQQIETALK